MTKACTICREEKPATEFWLRKDGRPRSWCKPCATQRNRQWDAAHPEAARRHATNSNRKRKFGITAQEYDDLLATQGGVCAICRQACKTARSLAVDHDHETGAIRGLLCVACNLILGHAGDDPVRLQAAIDYLRKEDRQWPS